jgi:PAP_fibrillin
MAVLLSKCSKVCTAHRVHHALTHAVLQGTMDLLGGTWTLAYTSNSELIALLALGKLPLVTIGDIQQTVDPVSATVLNKMSLSVPGSSTDFSTKASLTVESPKRVNLKFEQGTISTPQLATDLEIPDFTNVMGQSVDLRQAKSALQPLTDASKNAASMVRTLACLWSHKTPQGEHVSNFSCVNGAFKVHYVSLHQSAYCSS